MDTEGRRSTPRPARGWTGLLASAGIVALATLSLSAAGAGAQTAKSDGLEEAVVDEMLRAGTSDR